MKKNIKPISAKTWSEVASKHPEFFRTVEKNGEESTIALIARYVKKNNNVILTDDIVKVLLETAIKLYDHQVRRKERWKIYLLPFLSAVIGGAFVSLGTIIAAYLKIK